MSTFRVILEEGTVPIILEKVADHGSTETYENFSLFFLGPLEPFLPQQMYTITHHQLGEQQLFMVPIGQQKEGLEYQIVFNRLLNHGEGV